MVIETSIGNYLQNLRKERKMSLRDVADHIGIDVSMLSKIEHGDRQIQSYMLRGFCDLFNLEYKKVQIEYLNYKIENEFKDEPFLKDAVLELAKRLK